VWGARGDLVSIQHTHFGVLPHPFFPLLISLIDEIFFFFVLILGSFGVAVTVILSSEEQQLLDLIRDNSADIKRLDQADRGPGVAQNTS
jgi:hypothetical protein